MGHCCSILTFDGATSKAEMQAELNDWIYNNYDRLEGPCPSFAINWSREGKIFDGYKAAEDYLDGTFGNYDQYAVKYHPEAKSEPPAAYVKLMDRCRREAGKLGSAVYAAYHYLDGISSAYITCKECGSKLNRELMAKALSDNYTEEDAINAAARKVRYGASDWTDKNMRPTPSSFITAATRPNSCPLCHNCLLPKTTVASLEAKASKVVELLAKAMDVKAANVRYDKSKVLWAVAAECHC